ncbi:endoplasmic reticulum oxidoreductin 1 [Backusella circina FSU 941]|nr:endoplasmic reticulum oxidoreductin 1 [Backusella circina FSU 941]
MRSSALFLLIGNLVGITLQLKGPVLQEDPAPVRFVEQVLSSNNPKDYCNPHGQIKDTCCDYQSIESIQGDVFGKLQELVKTRFFRHYRADLWKECPFWNENALCLNRDCSVATTDESFLPVEWRKDALSAIQLPSKGALFQPFTQCSYKDQDFCLVDDKLDSNSVVYIDLLENPERFTGYAGPSSARVWKSIYEENCFDIVHHMTEGCETCNNEQKRVSEKQQPFASVPNTQRELNQYLNDLQEESDKEEVCLEKRVYYRLISGLHSSISIHICDEWFDQETGVWGPNLDCFVNRIGAHPERLQNIYFTYALVLRSIKKIGLYLEDYEFRTGSQEEDNIIKGMVQSLVRSTDSCPSTFDERSMFKGPQAQTLKLEFRDHFRNVSKIMDCVGCEKCRLWGKIQTVGLGTALKVLFSYEDKSLNHKENPDLFERGEIVALFNTFNRLSESLNAIQKFRKLYADKMSPPVVSSLDECVY